MHVHRDAVDDSTWDADNAKDVCAWDAHDVDSVCDVHVYRLLLVTRNTAEATVSLEPMRLEPQECVRGQSHAANGVSCYIHGQLLHPIPRRVCTGKLHMVQKTCDICTHIHGAWEEGA